MKVSFKYLLAFNNNSMIQLYFKGFFVDIVISSNQGSCKIKNVVSATRPATMALQGDCITRKISADCYEPGFRS